jgi:hypothetical protein
MDYGAAAARYVDIFMEAIRWDNAMKLYENYSRDAAAVEHMRISLVGKSIALMHITFETFAKP